MIDLIKGRAGQCGVLPPLGWVHGFSPQAPRYPTSTCNIGEYSFLSKPFSIHYYSHITIVHQGNDSTKLVFSKKINVHDVTDMVALIILLFFRKSSYYR